MTHTDIDIYDYHYIFYITCCIIFYFLDFFIISTLFYEILNSYVLH